MVKVDLLLVTQKGEIWVTQLLVLVCWCQSLGLESLEIPLAFPLWLQDGHRELENDINTMFQASLQSLFPSAPTPHQEGQNFPEALSSFPYLSLARTGTHGQPLLRVRLRKKISNLLPRMPVRMKRFRKVSNVRLVMQSISGYNLKGKASLHFPILSKQTDCLLLKYINRINFLITEHLYFYIC